MESYKPKAMMLIWREKGRAWATKHTNHFKQSCSSQQGNDLNFKAVVSK